MPARARLRFDCLYARDAHTIKSRYLNGEKVIQTVTWTVLACFLRAAFLGGLGFFCLLAGPLFWAAGLVELACSGAAVAPCSATVAVALVVSMFVMCVLVFLRLVCA